MIPHCCPFLYHQSQELNKENIFYIYTNILFCLKICFTNHCITLLKRIFFKYFFVRIRTPIIDPSWPQNIMVWTHLNLLDIRNFIQNLYYTNYIVQEKNTFLGKKIPSYFIYFCIIVPIMRLGPSNETLIALYQGWFNMPYLVKICLVVFRKTVTSNELWAQVS